MKLQDKERQHPPFDVPSGMAAALLTQGFIKVEPEIKRPTPNLQWAARPGVREQDYQHQPYLVCSCSTCDQRFTIDSKKGTAHISAEIRHCGVVDRCPADAAAKYLKLFNDWKSRSRRPVAKVSASTPSALNRVFGLKTREELISEAVTEARITSSRKA
jgi:hypothetical protein